MDGNDAIGEVQDVAGLTRDFDVGGECGGFTAVFHKDTIDEGSTGNTGLCEFSRLKGGVLVVDLGVAEVVGINVADIEPVDGSGEGVA